MITINRAFAIIRHYGKSFLCINTAKNDAKYLIYLSIYFYKTSINIIYIYYIDVTLILYIYFYY